MGIGLGAVRRMGIPFTCEISEYMRTMVYRIPGRIIREGHLSPVVLKGTPDFRATMVTDAVAYIREHDFTGQYELDANFAAALSKACNIHEDQSALSRYVVIQFKEDMQSFQAVDGQCIKIEHDGIDELAIVDCDDADMPRPDDRASNINAVLTAVRIAFEVTDSFEEQLDRRCYIATDRTCLYPMSPTFSACLSVENPQALQEVEARAEACRGLVGRITDGIESGRTGGKRRYKPDFAVCLTALIRTLRLGPPSEDPYLRLWFLELYDRAEKFVDTWDGQLGQDQRDATAHRNDVAHRGVEKIDEKHVKTLQEAIFRYIESRV